MPIPHAHSQTFSNLPRQSYFYGRSAELQSIAMTLDPDARSWGVLIDGPGGIGKTALAVRAAQLAQGFSHKLFVSAKVRELLADGEQSLTDFMRPDFPGVLAELARLLGAPELARIESEQRAVAIRTLLVETKALLVVDNLETFAETERVRLYEFLARLPVACKAIVTSRRRNDIDARILRLDRMNRNDALELLARMAADHPLLAAADTRARETLYESTQGNPLLMQWLVGQLQRRGSVAAACAFLNAAPADNDPLEYIFGDLVDAFTSPEAASLAALVHFREPVTIERIADIAELSVWQTQTALDDLSRRALAASDVEVQHYFLPALAGSFLRRKAQAQVEASGVRLCAKAQTLVQQHGTNINGYPTLEQEWPLLNAALPLFLHGDVNRLQNLAAQLDKFFEFSGHWDTWLWFSQQAEIHALLHANPRAAGWNAYRAGWVCYLRGRGDEVLACAARAAEHWRETETTDRERATAVYLRGHGHRLQGEISAAVSAYREAVELWRTDGDGGESVAIGLNALANAEKDASEYQAADQHYREALHLAQQADYQEGVAYITGNLSELALVREDWETAERLAREALKLSEAVGRHEVIALDCQRLAKLLQHRQQIDEALVLARRAAELFGHLGMTGQLQMIEAFIVECEVSATNAGII